MATESRPVSGRVEWSSAPPPETGGRRLPAVGAMRVASGRRRRMGRGGRDYRDGSAPWCAPSGPPGGHRQRAGAVTQAARATSPPMNGTMATAAQDREPRQELQEQPARSQPHRPSKTARAGDVAQREQKGEREQRRPQSSTARRRPASRPPSDGCSRPPPCSRRRNDMNRAFTAEMRHARTRVSAVASWRVETRWGAIEYVDQGDGVPLFLSQAVLGGHDNARELVDLWFSPECLARLPHRGLATSARACRPARRSATRPTPTQRSSIISISTES